VSYDVLGGNAYQQPVLRPTRRAPPAVACTESQDSSGPMRWSLSKARFSSAPITGPRNGAAQDTGEQKAPTLTTVNTFNPDSFATEVTILAIRWTDEAPAGLPSHHKPAPVVATPPVEAPPAAATRSPQSARPLSLPNRILQRQHRRLRHRLRRRLRQLNSHSTADWLRGF
jgi:hypothetical protein